MDYEKWKIGFTCRFFGRNKLDVGGGRRHVFAHMSGKGSENQSTADLRGEKQTADVTDTQAWTG